MKRNRKRVRHDYSLVDAQEKYAQIRSKEYYGIFIRKGRVHVDTRRFHKTLKELGAEEFWREGMGANRSTPYLIPKKQRSDEYGVNIALHIINSLKKDWAEEFLPAIQAIKTPASVGENARLEAMSIRSGEDAYDEAQTIGMCASIERIPKYHDVITTIHCSYIQRIASECDRAMAFMFRKRGNVGDAFTFDELLGHINELAHGNKTKKLENVKHYRAFESIRKLDNFLKHHTIKSYLAVKKYCPDYLVEYDCKYENGMYAPYWLKFPEEYIEATLDELLLFFTDFCLMFFDESADVAEWNSDQYFLHVYKEICDPEVYLGVYDKWGNSLVG